MHMFRYLVLAHSTKLRLLTTTTLIARFGGKFIAKGSHTLNGVVD